MKNPAASALFAHNDQEAEWWYVHGHVSSPDGGLGFHLAFFRHRTDPVRIGGVLPVRWLGPHFRFAHFGVTDWHASQFHFVHRRSFGTDAGASPSEFRVWHGDWSIRDTPAGWRLAASVKCIRLELDLRPQKPLLRFRTSTPENPHADYQSCPRLLVTGRLWRNGREIKTEGEAWLDHEWGRLGLRPDRHGWDWFGLHLDREHELVMYQLRDRHGTRTAQAFAALVEPDGRIVTLPIDTVTATPLAWTRSPRTGIAYPVEWRLSAETPALDLHVSSRIPCHEVDTRGSTCVIYWESPVTCAGRLRGQPIAGRGFTELTGYDHRPDRSGIFNFERGGLTVTGGLANEWRFLSHKNGITHTPAAWPVFKAP